MYISMSFYPSLSADCVITLWNIQYVLVIFLHCHVYCVLFDLSILLQKQSQGHDYIVFLFFKTKNTNNWAYLQLYKIIIQIRTVCKCHVLYLFSSILWRPSWRWWNRFCLPKISLPVAGFLTHVCYSIQRSLVSSFPTHVRVWSLTPVRSSFVFPSFTPSFVEFWD